MILEAQTRRPGGARRPRADFFQEPEIWGERHASGTFKIWPRGSMRTQVKPEIPGNATGKGIFERFSVGLRMGRKRRTIRETTEVRQSKRGCGSLFRTRSIDGQKGKVSNVYTEAVVSRRFWASLIHLSALSGFNAWWQGQTMFGHKKSDGSGSRRNHNENLNKQQRRFET